MPSLRFEYELNSFGVEMKKKMSNQKYSLSEKSPIIIIIIRSTWMIQQIYNFQINNFLLEN